MKNDSDYMRIAHNISRESNCISRQIGAVIVKDGRIISVGCNSSPNGCKGCDQRNFCMRREMSIPSGEKTEVCYAVHA